MKRDMDLIRKLLIYFDDKEGPACIEVPLIDGYDELFIKHHLVLMYDGGFIVCEPTRSTTSDRVISVLPFELTWKGHDFLEAIKSDRIWEKVKKTISAKGVGMAFAIIQGLATKYSLSLVDL